MYDSTNPLTEQMLTNCIWVAKCHPLHGFRKIFQFMCFSLIEYTSEDSMIIESIFVSVTSAVYYALDTCWINWKGTNPWTIIGQGTISN